MRTNCNKYFICLDTHEKEIFLEHAMPLVFPKNHVIFANGDNPDYVYFIEKGRVKIYRLTKDGQIITVAMRHTNELFGLAEVFIDEPRKCFAETLETVAVHAMKKPDFIKILTQLPELSVKINSVLGYRLRRAEEVIYDLINYNVSGRLARFLLSMQEQCGRKTCNGTVLDIKLTHQDIAAIIGTTRQSVTQLLSEYKEEGLLLIEEKRIVLVDTQKLQKKIY